MIRRTVTRNANDVTAEQQTILTRIADAVPSITGNLTSVLLHALFFGLWIAINLSLFASIRAFDPYPFGLLSVIVSLEAIVLTLFVLTSQNRQRARERIRSDIEFETSMNTELKMVYLHEKIDRLAEGQYQLAVNVQKLVEGRRSN